MLSIFLVTLFISAVHGIDRPSPTESYKLSESFDSGNIHLYWNYTDTHITFEVHGHTQGWVGIGFSPNGAMTGADMFVGWIKDGKVHVTDRHGIDNTFPPKDPKQDIDVITGWECDGWTMFKFSRQLAACESEFDREITHGTQRFIWAHGQTDPSGDDIQPENYHGLSRGVRSMYFLESIDKPSDELPSGVEYETFDIMASEFNIPANDTYYNCRVFKIDQLKKKHHVVKFEPIIQEGNEAYVHHMVATLCVAPTSEKDAGQDKICSFDISRSFPHCLELMAVWAVGGGPFIYPENVGFPLTNEEGDSIYIMLETHYDNPNLKTDIIDSSGLIFTYTSSLRQYDAGVLEIGNIVLGLNHFVPPGAKSFTSAGYCASDCLAKSMDDSGADSLNILSVFLHTHLAGRAVTFRHFRDGKELPFVAYDDSYDFDYQQMRHIYPPVNVKPRDMFRVDCKYNTEGKKEMLEGGLGTNQEMCLVFALYYPKISVSYCQTAADTPGLYSYFGVKNTTGFGFNLRNYTVTEPEALKGKSLMEVYSEYNWTEENIDKFSEAYATMTQMLFCLSDNWTEITYETNLTLPGITSFYTPPTKTCSAATGVLSQMKEEKKCIVTATSSAKEITTATESIPTTTGSNGNTQGYSKILFILSFCILIASI